MNTVNQRIANLSPEKLALLQQKLAQKNPVKSGKIVRRDSSADCPLSFTQQRLWFLDRLEPDNPFNISIAIKLQGELDLAALQQALDTIVERHQVLRTTFAEVNEAPIQVVAESKSVQIDRIDLSQELDNHDRQVKIDSLLERAAEYKFDLTAEVMLRATLIQLSPTESNLLLVIHHIAADGWSMGILFRELAGFYTAFASGTPAPFAELPIQYGDFAAWQRQWLTGAVLDKQLDYWKQQLTGAPTLLELPLDRPRPAIKTSEGRTIYFQVSTELTQQLKDLSQKSGATLFMTLLAAFAVLLSRYSGQDDVVIGSPIANRHRSEVEASIGCFINSLALRTKLAGNPTFRELLDRVRETTLGAYDHQDLPLEKVVEELQPERSLSYSPIFQVMFVFQNAPMGKLALPGLTLTPLTLEDLTAKDDLFLSMGETETGIAAELTYNSDLFDAERIDRLTGHFQTLLAEIVTQPDTSVQQLPILTPTERQQLLGEWNQTDRDYPLDKTFSEVFASIVEHYPDSIAATYQQQQLTYQELNDRSNRWANLLIEQGIEPETPIAVFSDRHLDFLTAILAIFKAGGAYLPLSPTQPAERTRQILAQSEVKLILSDRSIPNDTPAQILTFTDLDSRAAASGNPIDRSTPDSLAYIIYTSGSTGTPKGAMLEHRGMLNHLLAKVTDLHLTSADVVAQTASQTFDISIWQFLVPLLVGGKVEIIPPEIAADPIQLLTLARQQSITILEVVPSLLRMMLEAIGSGSNRIDLSCLRWLLLTGEALPPQLVREWFMLYPHIPLMNAYGPTECSDDVTHNPIYQPPALDVLTIPIGRPVANTQLYVLDAGMQPVPIGVDGELYVGGAGVGRGYLNAPELTAKAFVANPFGAGRLYKTGDKVRYLADGKIDFLGRLDYQVKIRGFRIELGEIEAVLSSHPQVRESIVIVSGQVLVAYVVGGGTHPVAPRHPSVGEASARAEEGNLAASELREFLKGKLPDYMVPHAIVMLESMPLTGNGKIDRKALPVPEFQPESAGFARPSTPTEVAVAGLWGQVLKLERVGMRSNFFDLGGHSLLATQVVSRVRSLFGVEMPLRRLFESPTVEGLSGWIDGLREVEIDREEFEF
jgi:amino acid adenylation domain-containing protein